MNAVSEVTQRAWVGRLDSERLYRYYTKLADRNRKRHLVTTAAIAVLAATSGSFLLAQAHPMVIAAFTFATMAGGISLLFFDFATKAANASSASNHFEWLMHEWRQIWWSQHEAGIIDRIKLIETQMLVSVEVDIGVDDKLNLECDEQAERTIRAEYGEFAV